MPAIRSFTDGQEKLQPGEKVEPQRSAPPGNIGPTDQEMGATPGTGA
jgi:hypothetical protein